MSQEFVLHQQLANDCFEIMDLPLCKLLLCNDSAYPWFILVPRVAENIRDIYQLDWQQQQQFLNESSMLSELLMQEYAGEKMNVAALGNVVSQLHIHHVVRFTHDACWPKPIWGQQPLTPYSPEQAKKIQVGLVEKLSAIIATQSNN